MVAGLVKNFIERVQTAMLRTDARPARPDLPETMAMTVSPAMLVTQAPPVSREPTPASNCRATDVAVGARTELLVNLAHLAHLLATNTDKYVRLELEWNKVRGRAH